jgi:hypothetical protein
MRVALVVAIVLLGSPAAAEVAAVRPVALAGQPAPGGGRFDRFGVEGQPVVAPVNGRGQVAFFATVLRGAAAEGLFISDGGRRIRRLALDGDAVGVGTLSGFARHPIPALNGAGSVAFAAGLAGGTAVEGIFLASRGRLAPVALTGRPAGGIPGATLASVDAPALNDRDEVVFLATVRRGRETLEAVYLARAGRLRKLVVQGDGAPAGGAFAAFGPPVINNRGEVAFAAVVEGRAVPGGVFLIGTEGVRMLLGAGDVSPIGGIYEKFSERVALDDTGAVAVTTVLRGGPSPLAVVLVDRGGARKVAAVGDEAPGGGRFSNFGPWPALADGRVAFTASVDGGPADVAAFVADSGGLRKVIGVGDALPGERRVRSLGLYPVVSLAPSGAVSAFADPDGLLLLEPR